jgi:hypothetical protein
MPANKPAVNYQVVVARYNESIDWLSMFKQSRVHIYNKGSPLPKSQYNVVELPNVGREAHTYLQYVVDNYHKLPDVIFFTQGRIDDHVEPLTKKFVFDTYIYIDKVCKRVSFDAITSGFNENRLLEWKGELAPASCDALEFYKRYIGDGEDVPYPAFIYWAGIFSVKKERILSRPLSFYKTLLALPELQHSNCEVAHYFERMWFYVFNCHKPVAALKDYSTAE